LIVIILITLDLFVKHWRPSSASSARRRRDAGMISM